MNRIVRVALQNYKGLARDYTLAPATVLQGPNGVGKSAALEAIVYALSGKVPGGSKLDSVAQYFPPRGGYVEVEDDAGNWIRRGITRDQEKAKVSEVLEVSGCPEGEPVERYLAPWVAAQTVLDLREFLGLSPEKRREYVLELCGSGEGDLGAIIQEIAAQYAREIGGKGAPVAILAPAGKRPELDPEVAELAEAWSRRRGLDEVLRSHLVAGKSISETCLKLSAVAKESKLGARKSALDAKSAIRELEAEAKGAEVAAQEIEDRKRETERLRAELTTAKERRARAMEAQSGAEAAALSRENAGKRFAAALVRVRDLPEPTPAPVPPQGDPRREEALKALALERKAYSEDREKLQFLRRDEERTAELNTESLILERQATEHRKSAIGRALGLLGEIPDSADPSMPELRDAIEELGAEWKRRMDELDTQGREKLAQKEFLAAKVEAHKEERAHLKSELERREVEIPKLDVLLEELAQRTAKSQGEYAKAKTNWDAQQGFRREAETALERETALVEEADQILRDAQARLDEVGKGLPQEPIVDVIEGIEAKLAYAQEAEEAARKAQGAAEAYRAAVDRAEQNKVEEEAWKAAERAIACVREKLVGAATAPLLGTLNEVLAQAAREERAYLDLENDRGKPIFELGWVRGDQRIPHPALSAGEAAIFGAALSIAIALRTRGRRVLLAEADPLDAGNLAAFLGALLPWAPQLDALIIATASPVPETSGWEVIHLGEEASLATH